MHTNDEVYVNVLCFRRHQHSPPRQAWIMITLGLSFKLGQLEVFKIWKTVLTFNTSGFPSENFFPQMPSWIPWDMNTTKVLSDFRCSGRAANPFSSVIMSWKRTHHWSWTTGLMIMVSWEFKKDTLTDFLGAKKINVLWRQFKFKFREWQRKGSRMPFRHF